MVGHGEKGLLITTGRFTSSAEDESTRDGAPPVEIIRESDEYHREKNLSFRSRYDVGY